MIEIITRVSQVLGLVGAGFLLYNVLRIRLFILNRGLVLSRILLDGLLAFLSLLLILGAATLTASLVFGVRTWPELVAVISVYFCVSAWIGAIRLHRWFKEREDAVGSSEHRANRIRD